jgi:hypothetical protein
MPHGQVLEPVRQDVHTRQHADEVTTDERVVENVMRHDRQCHGTDHHTAVAASQSGEVLVHATSIGASPTARGRGAASRDGETDLWTALPRGKPTQKPTQDRTSYQLASRSTAAATRSSVAVRATRTCR